MRPIFSLRLAAVLILAVSSALAAPPKAPKTPPAKIYVNDDLASQGDQLAQKAQDDTKALRASTPPAELRRQFTEAALRNDLPRQITLLEALAAATPDDSSLWLTLGRAELSAASRKDARRKHAEGSGPGGGLAGLPESQKRRRRGQRPRPDRPGLCVARSPGATR